MKKLAPYRKFIVAVIGAGLASASVSFSDSPGVTKALVIATSMVTAAGVYRADNEDAKPAEG